MARHFPISKQTFSSDILSLWPLPCAGQMARTDPEPLPAADSLSLSTGTSDGVTNYYEKLRWILPTAQLYLRGHMKVRELIRGTVEDGKIGTWNCIYWLPCVWLIFFMVDAHEVTIGYKQQMIWFISGEHSAPQLSPLSEHAILWMWVLFASSVAWPGFLPPWAPAPEVCTASHFPLPSLLLHSWKSLSDADNTPIPLCNYTSRT